MNDTLRGLRIWLSGSVPTDTGAADKERIRSFVAGLARAVFERGGTLVHGSHPTIRDVLLEEARAFKAATGRPAPLLLVVSQYYSKDSARFGVDIPAWNDVCEEKVIETAEVVGVASEADRPSKASLSLMRRRLAEQTNVIIAVGGRWWNGAPGQAGVPEEIDAARHYRMPLFLLGGLGGATAGFLDANPELLAVCHNGLTTEENRALAAAQDVDHVVAVIVARLEAVARERREKVGVTGGAPGRSVPPASVAAPARIPRRILCLDGGGIRGAFTAAVLDRLEQLTRQKIIEHFDLIVGTSTGGILAIGLAMGVPPGRILAFYREDGPVIFPGDGNVGGAWLEFQHWFATKFDARVLEERLRAAFAGSATVKSSQLADALVRVAVTAYDAESDRAIVYRTPHGPDGTLSENIDRLDAALATSAAPTYFSARQIDHAKAIDGGVWANSPTVVALAEAADLGWDLADVSILSVGTTFTPTLLARPLHIDKKLVKQLLSFMVPGPLATIISMFWKPQPVEGKLGWVATIAGLLMKTQSQSAAHVCRRLLAEDAYLRVDAPTIDTPMDKAGAINRLIGLGEEEAMSNKAKVETRFLNGIPAPKWQRPPAAAAVGRP